MTRLRRLLARLASRPPLRHLASCVTISTHATRPRVALSRRARALRATHNMIGACELACLAYLWFCAITRRRDLRLRFAVAVLAGEGVALFLGEGCPLGIFQRRAGDDVPMFELWFGPRLAPFAVPTFTLIAVGGVALVVARRPMAPIARPWGTRSDDRPAPSN